MEPGVLVDLEKIAKRACKITWSDSSTDDEIQGIVKTAVVALAHKLGMGEEFEAESFKEPGMDRMLFENYCLYSWNKMTSEFEKNYKSEILTARHKHEVKNAKKNNEQLQ